MNSTHSTSNSNSNSNSDSHKKSHGREYALHFLYQVMAQSKALHSLPHGLDQIHNLDKSLMEFDGTYFENDSEHKGQGLSTEVSNFSKKLIQLSIQFQKDIHGEIQNLSSEKNLDKMENVNYCLLLMGGIELKCEADTPTAVIINEYINMAKKFGPPDSAGYINNVLDKMAKLYRATV